MNRENLSINHLAVLLAFEKGYRVTKSGKVKGLRKSKISPNDSGNGYLRFAISSDGKQYHVGVHQLQAFQKFGKRLFQPDLEVRHLDNNKKNNSWDNISIGTHAQNVRDLPKDQIKRNTKLTKGKVREIRKKVKNNNYSTQERLAQKYDITQPHLSDIVNNKVWSDV